MLYLNCPTIRYPTSPLFRTCPALPGRTGRTGPSAAPVVAAEPDAVPATVSAETETAEMVTMRRRRRATARGVPAGRPGPSGPTAHSPVGEASGIME